MTAGCRDSCCSVTPRFTVTELFERGFRRSRAAPIAIEGQSCTDADGHTAWFSTHIVDRRLAEIQFRASSCATLIAYCECIAETVADAGVDIAQALTAADLVQAVPGVPSLKRGRAVLAITAFRAGLAAASNETSIKSGER
jgi:hypothetical protein